MTIPSHELEAFAAAARARTISGAAALVHVTQPALTQRIQNLERALGVTLFVRDRKGVTLTAAGERLLRYCQVKEELEGELLAELGRRTELAGTLRVAAYSSVLHSVVVPALAPLVRANAGIVLEVAAREMAELPAMLLRGEVDLIVLDHALERADVDGFVLGVETNVLIEPAGRRCPDVYLDHDAADRTTQEYLKLQGDRRPFRRAYLDDIAGILNGVALGLGRGVVPRHLIASELPVRRVPRQRPLEVPVVLHRRKQPYHARLQETAVQALTRGCARLLDRGGRPRSSGARGR